jgi:hypothetical protein
MTLLDLVKAPEGSDAHTLHSHFKTSEPFTLSLLLVTLTTSTSVQDNTKLSSLTGHRAFFGLN